MSHKVITNERVLVWDIETLQEPREGEPFDEYRARCGISMAAVWDALDRSWHLYGPHDIDELVSALEKADRVVGYNSIGFDHLVLDQVAGRRVIIQDEVDLWRIIQASMGASTWGAGKGTLDAVARRTLGYGKSGSGREAPALAQEGRWMELANYCMRDVDLTRELWEFMENHGYVINPVGQKHMVGEAYEMEGQPDAVVESGLRESA